MANKKKNEEEIIIEELNVKDKDPHAEIESLKAQLEQMTKLVATIMAQNTACGNGLNQKTNSLNEEIKIIHLLDNPVGITTHIELSNMIIDFGRFGEERTLDRRQAEELSGKYRTWFENGYIAFSADSEEFAKKFSLKTVNNYSYISKNFLENIATLNSIELEDFYSKLSIGHKEFLIGYFKRKIMEGKDPRFSDPQKIEMLNRVTAEEAPDHRGAMETIILTRSKQNIKK